MRVPDERRVVPDLRLALLRVPAAARVPAAFVPDDLRAGDLRAGDLRAPPRPELLDERAPDEDEDDPLSSSSAHLPLITR